MSIKAIGSATLSCRSVCSKTRQAGWVKTAPTLGIILLNLHCYALRWLQPPSTLNTKGTKALRVKEYNHKVVELVFKLWLNLSWICALSHQDKRFHFTGLWSQLANQRFLYLSNPWTFFQTLYGTYYPQRIPVNPCRAIGDRQQDTQSLTGRWCFESTYLPLINIQTSYTHPHLKLCHAPLENHLTIRQDFAKLHFQEFPFIKNVFFQT